MTDRRVWRRIPRIWATDVDADVGAELQFHLDMRAREFEASGLSPDAARRAALDRFGDVRGVSDSLSAHDRRAARHLSWSRTMERFWQHVRHSVRALRRAPIFTVVAVATLALGIGANSAIFSVVNAVLLEPLPYRAPDRLALIWSRWTNFDKTWLSEAEYLDYAQQHRVFADVAAWGENGEVALTGRGGAPESVDAVGMTANFLDVVGMHPLAGRTFTEAEDVPDGPPVVMVGYDLWVRRFGADPHLVGRTIQVDGTSRLVVGILPRRFRFPLEFQRRNTAQIIQPLQPNRSAPVRGSHGWYGVARLAPGASVPMASNALRALAAHWTDERLYPPDMHFTAFAVPLIQEVSGGAKLALLLLAAAVGLLLLLTCVNVANLILARADGRTREAAVRSALGAGRGDLLALALAEGVMLGALGGALGLALAWGGVRLLVARAPTTVPRLGELSIDGRVLAVTFVLAIATGIVFGVLPTLRATRLDLSRALRDGARGASGGVERRRARAALVIAEMALAVILVIGAGLTIRSFANLQGIDPGFDPRNVLTLRLSLPAARYDSAAPVAGFYRLLGDGVRALPGVASAGFVRQLPLDTEIGDAGTEIEGRPVPAGEPGRSADWQVVTPGYLEAMHERVVRGRAFTPADGPDAMPVIAVNETFAREYFPNEDPIGKRLRVGGSNQPWRTIVGVYGDVHHNSLITPVKRMWFLPHAQWGTMFGSPRRSMTLVVRTRGDPRAALRPIEDLIHRADADLPVTHVQTLDDVLGAATREQRFTMALMTGFAALALVLAAVGIYGVMASAVGHRTREIGIRLALGADVRAVRALVLRQGMVPATTGVAVGVACALVLTRYLRNLLYGVAPIDPVTFTVIPLLLMLVAVASILIPAVRASRVQPVDALRIE